MIKRALILFVNTALYGLPSSWRFKLLLLLADMHRIETVVVPGDYGDIEGSLHDFGIFTHYMGYRSWSKEVVELIANRMEHSPIGTYIDVGANIGLTIIPLARFVTWDFHAFEPDPANFLLLRLNLLRNQVGDRVNTYNVALSSTEGTLKLKRSPQNFGDFRIETSDFGTSSEDRCWPTVEVRTKPLDDILSAENLQRPIFIKIDTQGAEPLVVSGGTKILSNADLIVMEFWPYGISRLGQDCWGLLDTLQALRGNVQALDSLTGIVIARSFEEIRQITQRIVSDASLEQFDLLISRSERCDSTTA